MKIRSLRDVVHLASFVNPYLANVENMVSS